MTVFTLPQDLDDESDEDRPGGQVHKGIRKAPVLRQEHGTSSAKALHALQARPSASPVIRRLSFTTPGGEDDASSRGQKAAATKSQLTAHTPITSTRNHPRPITTVFKTSPVKQLSSPVTRQSQPSASFTQSASVFSVPQDLASSSGDEAESVCGAVLQDHVWKGFLPELPQDAYFQRARYTRLQKHASAAATRRRTGLHARVDDGVGLGADGDVLASILSSLAVEEQGIAAARRQEDRKVKETVASMSTAAAESLAKFKREDARRRAEAARTEEAQRNAELKKREEEQRRAEDARKQAERQQQAEAQAKRDAEAAEEARKQAAERDAAEAAQKPAAATDPHVKASPGALLEAAANAQALQDVEDSTAYQQYKDDPQSKKQRRDMEKAIGRAIQQISATQAQIQSKSKDLISIIAAAPEGPARSHAHIVCAKKLLYQCESQVTRLNSFAFPLAMVTANVATAHPPVLQIVIAKLQEVSPFCIPQFVVQVDGQPDEGQWKRRNGYREVEEGVNHKRMETNDEFVDRNNGYILFYSALLQSTPSGVAAAWAYVARFLNCMPASRISAAALYNFLSNAGYMLHASYGRQFLKMLRVVVDEFVPELDRLRDPEAGAARTRLEMYWTNSRYRSAPEGRTIKASDESAAVHA